MELNEINRLLNPAPLAMEMGYERLASGVLHVACRTDLHGVTGESFEWWFRAKPGTREYKWWHPTDHVSSEWEGTSEGTHVGLTHKVIESFAGGPQLHLKIQFAENTEFFSAAELSEAKNNGSISALICGRTSESWEPHMTPDDNIVGGRLFHVGRDTEWGMVLRSHFFIASDLPSLGMSASDIMELAPDVIGPGLLQHCYEEFTYLSRFLPSIFIAESGNAHSRKTPW